jgi:hypothetical protein
VEAVYIETTIFSYLVAKPSRDLLLAAHQQVTREWWATKRAQYQCLSSEEVLREAGQGDAEMSKSRLEAMKDMPLITISREVEALASLFLSTGALPSGMRPDAVHLAAATVSGADYLLTWNCRHLANAQILRRLRKEADRRGWSLPDVCTPLELMGNS